MSEVVIIPREKPPEPEPKKVQTQEELMTKLATRMLNSRPRERPVK
jgi:hypothetical protein